LLCTGFADEMTAELEAAKSAPFTSHLDQWVDLISNPAIPLVSESSGSEQQRSKPSPNLRPAAIA
jgi:hypothetical protein